MCHKLIFLLLALFLLLAACAPASVEPGVQIEPASPTLTQLVEDSGYPGPVPTPEVPPPSLPTRIVLEPGEFYDGRETPFPTFTPLPTPTRIPGPTTTALPLREPAKDAKGIIMYAVKENETRAAVYSVSVDSVGLAENNPVRLSDEEQGTSWAAIPYPAPDGSRLVYDDLAWGGRTVFYPETGHREPLFREKLDPLGQFFNWHPNNRQVLIRADDSYTDVGLWLVDVDTGKHITLLTQFPAPNSTGGAISPDGQKVVYALKRGFSNPGELWLINADGSEPRLLRNGGAMFAFDWSPDGKKIAFVDLSQGLMVIDADGANPHIVSRNFYRGYNFRPVWSPDGRLIAFVAYDGPEYSQGVFTGDQNTDAFIGTNIHLVDVDSGREYPLLAEDSTGNIDPAWSPDGSQMVFASTRSGKSEIWVVNVDGTNLRQLTVTEQPVRFPYWSVPPRSQQ